MNPREQIEHLIEVQRKNLDDIQKKYASDVSTRTMEGQEVVDSLMELNEILIAMDMIPARCSCQN